MGMYVYSAWIRYFREEICNNFDEDQVMLKVKELSKKYETNTTNDIPEFSRGK